MIGQAGVALADPLGIDVANDNDWRFSVSPSLGHEYAFSVRLNQVWNVPLSRPSLPWLCCT
jgi:hypothetical protein